MKKEAIEFRTLLGFGKDRHLVGVKFVSTQKEYEDLQVKEATHQMFFCMMVKAAVVGHCMKVKKEHIYCSAAAEVLGFSEPTSEVVNGKVAYARKLYETEKIAKNIFDGMPYIRHDVYGITIQPLESYESEPDVVMAFCSPYTAMRIVQGYSYKKGYAKKVQFSGMGGVCTELMASAYKNQDMNFSFLCSGTRFAANWRDDELGISFPYQVFLSVLDGVKKTMNTYEPDDKKEEISRRALQNNMSLDIEYGKNYHDSSIGVAKMGVKGYLQKRKKV